MTPERTARVVAAWERMSGHVQSVLVDAAATRAAVKQASRHTTCAAWAIVMVVTGSAVGLWFVAEDQRRQDREHIRSLAIEWKLGNEALLEGQRVLRRMGCTK